MHKGLLLAVVSVATLAAADKIAGGPYAVNVTPRSATVVWIVQGDQVTVRAPGGTPVAVSPALRVEKTTLTGLQPNTRYDYDVTGQDAGKGFFKTPPLANDLTPYQFVVYGDTRTRHDVHRRVIGEMLKHPIPDFVLHTGDLVEDGSDSALWPIFFDIEKDLLRKTAFFPALGNHERNSRQYYDFFQAGTPYYSFDWGNSHVIVINSDIANAAGTQREKDAFWAEQTRWLEDDLANHQDADYRFLMAHHPPFTAVASRQGSNPQMMALAPMLEKYHVSAAFFGHDHNYQHFLKNGVHYVTAGGGGAPLYDVSKPPQGITQKVISIENFVTVSVAGKTARFKATAIDGSTIEEFEIQGSPSIRPPR